MRGRVLIFALLERPALPVPARAQLAPTLCGSASRRPGPDTSLRTCSKVRHAALAVPAGQPTVLQVPSSKQVHPGLSKL